MVRDIPTPPFEPPAIMDWRDVIALPEPHINTDPKVNALIEAQLPDIIDALDDVAGTEIGQEILQALYAKQHDITYANGAYFGEKLILDVSQSIEAAYAEPSELLRLDGPTLFINTAKLETLTIIPIDGDHPVKMQLDTILIHELAHAADSRIFDKNNFIEYIVNMEEDVGISYHGGSLFVDKDHSTYASMTPEQQAILGRLQGAISDGNQLLVDQIKEEDFAILRENEAFAQWYDRLEMAVGMKIDIEHSAVNVANIYRDQRAEQGAVGYDYNRGDYELGYDIHAYHDKPAGVLIDEHIHEDTRAHADAEHRDWSDKYGEYAPNGPLNDDILPTVTPPWEDAPSDLQNILDSSLAWAQATDTTDISAPLNTPPQARASSPHIG